MLARWIPLCLATCLGCSNPRLSLYNAYRSGALNAVSSLRTDGFYFEPLHLESYAQGDDTSVLARSALFFYSDGAYFAPIWSEPRPVGQIAHMEQIHGSTIEQYGNTLIWCFWGLYQVAGDSVFLEGYTNINGRRQVACQLLHLSDNGVGLQELNSGRGALDTKPFKPREQRSIDISTYRFHPSGWKPDSTEYLQHDAQFIRANTRQMKRGAPLSH